MCAPVFSILGRDSTIAMRTDSVYGIDYLVTFEIPDVFKSGYAILSDVPITWIVEFRWDEEDSGVRAQILFDCFSYNSFNYKGTTIKSYDDDGVVFHHKIIGEHNFLDLGFEKYNLSVLAVFRHNKEVEEIIYSFLKSIKVEPLDENGKHQIFLFNPRKHNQIKPRVKIE